MIVSDICVGLWVVSGGEFSTSSIVEFSSWSHKIDIPSEKLAGSTPAPLEFIFWGVLCFETFEGIGLEFRFGEKIFRLELSSWGFNSFN